VKFQTLLHHEESMKPVADFAVIIAPELLTPLAEPLSLTFSLADKKLSLPCLCLACQPGGLSEISRWCKPPVTPAKYSEPWKGDGRKARHYRRPSRAWGTHSRHTGGLHHRLIFMAPPAPTSRCRDNAKHKLSLLEEEWGEGNSTFASSANQTAQLEAPSQANLASC
jgi:hypothetical protein